MAARHARHSPAGSTETGVAHRKAAAPARKRGPRMKAAAATAVLLAVGGVWCTQARVTSVMRVSGVLLAAEAPTAAVSPGNGRLAEVSVAPGQQVHPGTTLASITLADGTKAPVTSTEDGVVAAVVTRPGAAVKSGAQIVTIDRDRPTRALLLGDVGHAIGLHQGQRVHVALAEARAEGVVTAAPKDPVGPGDLPGLGAGDVPAPWTGQAVRVVEVTLDPGTAHPGARPMPITAVAVRTEHPIDVLLPHSAG
ncbi:biotin/lipoyl-containing protein [Kitasatospora camelliae]|uniref:Biotin/lipoyl-containing protein n=1 Tax=Kitasatospora camelliae TaxID=3156397 RepID=A0AAU8KA81_9ACTN